MDRHKINKQTKNPSRSPQKKDKNCLFEVRSVCLPNYFSRTCGVFSNSLLPAGGDGA